MSVEAENPGVVAVVGAHILAVWAGCVDVAYGEWCTIIGFVGGGIKVDVEHFMRSGVSRIMASADSWETGRGV